MTKVLAVNGSPHKEDGNTSLILKPFLEGMKEAGAEVDTIYTFSMELKSCTGEFICWGKTPGECYLEDDMDDIYPKLKEVEIVILATPVYIPLPGDFQKFLNRLCPILNPELDFRNGRTRAKLRDDYNIKKFVLVATCGWWEIGNFDRLIQIVRDIAEDASVEFARPILRPHAHLMRKEGTLTEDGEEIIQELRKASNNLISEGEIDKNTADKISHPLVTFKEYMGVRPDEYS